MNETSTVTTRREFLKTTGRLAAASALAGVAVPYVHAQGSDTIQVALIGCGGRGTGAAANAVSVNNANLKLVAMVDVFDEKLNRSYDALMKEHSEKVDVPQDRKFIGFDGYRHAMDLLKPGDIAIFTTPLAFRWVHFTYAIQKGLNVFMEKPLTADGPSSRKMLALADQAKAKNLKVGVGLMSRHHRPLQQLRQKIENGDLGEIIAMRGYRMDGPTASFRSERWPGKPSELLWQISRFHSFIWASGGCYNDFNIHIIDHLCWMKGAWPEKVQTVGGRHYRTGREGQRYVDQNFDVYASEFTFPDGTKLLFDGRCMEGCDDAYGSFIHGTKGMAIGSNHGDFGDTSSIYSGQKQVHSEMIWKSTTPKGEENPYQNEWNELVEAILKDKPYNEVPRSVSATVTCNMARMSAHTGRVMTYEDALNSEDVYSPGIEDFTLDSPPPVKSDANGIYPVPEPGIITDHEYDLGKV